MNKTIYVIRHGLTLANKENLCIGLKDSPLLGSSIKEINKIGNSLKNKEIETIITSDIGRAYNTSIIINLILNSKIIKNKNIRELDFGYFDLKSPQLLKKIQPELFDSEGYFKYETKLKNGESLKDLELRVKKFLRKIKNLDKNILIVSHGAVILMIYSLLNNISYNTVFKKININNNSIFEFNYIQIINLFNKNEAQK
jgi:broad specificity phosphatase PhoE